MKISAFVFAITPALALAAIAAPALAEHHGAKETAEAKAENLTVNTPLEKLMANEAAKAVVTKHMGGQDMTKHPIYDQFKTMSLVELQPWSRGAVTDAMIAGIKADLAQLS